MIIRRAKESDLQDLLRIYNYEVAHGVATFDVQEKTEEERAEWFWEHNVGNHLLFAAEEDGRAVGYVSLSAYREKEAYAATVEISLYVDAESRGRGVGRALMAEMIREAGKRDDIHSIVAVVTGGNAASIALCGEFGFAHCGTVREAGKKFGRLLDVDEFQLMV